jgi:hypothetical protein
MGKAFTAAAFIVGVVDGGSGLHTKSRDVTKRQEQEVQNRLRLERHTKVCSQRISGYVVQSVNSPDLRIMGATSKNSVRRRLRIDSDKS